MALNGCIEKALKARKITDKQVQDINRMVEQEQLSEQEVLERFIQKAKEAKQRVQLQAIATKKNLDLINSHPKGIGRGVLALLTRDIEGKASLQSRVLVGARTGGAKQGAGCGCSGGGITLIDTSKENGGPGVDRRFRREPS